MFRASTNDPRLFRDCIDTIAQLIDDGLFKLKKDGIELLASDRALVSVVDFKFKSSGFESYECDKEYVVGLNMLNLLTVLKRANPDDKLILELNENENKFNIKLEGKSKRNFSIPLIDVSTEKVPPLKLDFQALAEIKSDILEEGILDAGIFADSLVIEATEDMLRVFAEGNSSKSELKLEKGTEALPSLDVKKKVKSRFSLEYLKKMIKGSKLSEKAIINLGNDYPLKLEFLGDHASLSMILAPRVSEGD